MPVLPVDVVEAPNPPKGLLCVVVPEAPVLCWLFVFGAPKLKPEDPVPAAGAVEGVPKEKVGLACVEDAEEFSAKGFEGVVPVVLEVLLAPKPPKERAGLLALDVDA